MKKIIILLAMVLGMILMPKGTKAWDDCPHGLVDDPYPGECPRYVDTDNDGLCDHSQRAPEDRAVAEQAEEIEVVEVEMEAKPIKKLLPVIKLVLAHLAGILFYVGYKKYRLGRE